MKNAWADNGDTLLVLTYHEVGDNTPQFFQINGIGARATAAYYNMPMGGAFANGNDAAAISFVQTQVFTDNVIPQTASFEFSSEVSSTDDKTVAITVNTTAKQDIPAGVKLHIIVTEKTIKWMNTWPEGISETTGKTGNGQEIMYDVIWDMIGDTLGNDFPSISSGESHSMTHSFTLYTDRAQKSDSIEVTAVLQVESTKQILAVSRMVGTPFVEGSIPITSKGLSNTLKGLSLNINGKNAIFKLPFSQTEISLFNSAGRMLSKQKIDGLKGSSVSVKLPEAKGVIIMKLNSLKGDVFTQSLIIK